MLSPSEAKTKWCPFARIQDKQGAYNRLPDGSVPLQGRCFGGNCMAWKSLKNSNIGFCGITDNPGNTHRDMEIS
jgi:hypothetical protein